MKAPPAMALLLDLERVGGRRADVAIVDDEPDPLTCRALAGQRTQRRRCGLIRDALSMPLIMCRAATRSCRRRRLRLLVRGVRDATSPEQRRASVQDARNAIPASARLSRPSRTVVATTSASRQTMSMPRWRLLGLGATEVSRCTAGDPALFDARTREPGPEPARYVQAGGCRPSGALMAQTGSERCGGSRQSQWSAHLPVPAGRLARTCSRSAESRPATRCRLRGTAEPCCADQDPLAE